MSEYIEVFERTEIKYLLSHEQFIKLYGDVDIKSKKIRDSGMKFTTVSFNFEL